LLSRPIVFFVPTWGQLLMVSSFKMQFKVKLLHWDNAQTNNYYRIRCCFFQQPFKLTKRFLTEFENTLPTTYQRKWTNYYKSLTINYLSSPSSTIFIILIILSLKKKTSFVLKFMIHNFRDFHRWAFIILGPIGHLQWCTLYKNN
jgi:hypothetical protein